MKVLCPPSVGSAGAQTWQRSRAGTVLRSRRKPVRPLSLSGSNAGASRMRRCVAAWGKLTDAQRAAFSAAAGSELVVDALGQVVRLSAYNYFLRLSLRSMAIGFGPVTAPPAPGAGVSASSVSLSATSGLSGALTYTWTGLSAAVRLILKASGPQSIGSTFPASMRTLLQAVYASGSGSQNAGAYWVAQHGALPRGSRIFASLTAVKGPGIWTVLWRGSAEVV